MDEYVIKQKIRMACIEPRAPDELIEQVIFRSQAVTMGVTAQKQLAGASAVRVGELASRVMIGQLAAATPLPKGVQPEQLARQLEDNPAFQAALRGGNVVGRLSSGELLQQITGQTPKPEQPSLEQPSLEQPSAQKGGPCL